MDSDSLRVMLEFRLGFTSAHFSQLLASHLSLERDLWAPFRAAFPICHPPVLAISSTSFNLFPAFADVWCPTLVGILMPHCSTACAGAFQVKRFPPCWWHHSPLQPEPCLVPCLALQSQSPAVAAQSPSSSGMMLQGSHGALAGERGCFAGLCPALHQCVTQDWKRRAEPSGMRGWLFWTRDKPS